MNEPPRGTDLPRNPLRYLAAHRRWLAIGIMALLATNALAQAIPWVVKRTVEAMRALEGDRVGWLAIVVAGLAIAAASVRVLSRVYLFNAGREAEYRLRAQLFAHLCGLDASFFRRFPTGDLMSRLTNDLAAVRSMFGPGILYLVGTLFAYAIALPLMVHIDAGLTFWALLPYPLLLLGSRYFARGIYGRSHALQRALGQLNTALQEDLAGVRELKGYQLEKQRTRAFAELSQRYRSHALRLAAWRSGMLPFVGVGQGASLVLILWLGGQRVIQGHITLGDLVALNLYVALLAWPTMAIGWMLAVWQRGLAGWQRLREILAERPNLRDDPSLPAPTPPFGVSARDLSVKIGRKRPLQAVDFEIPSGTICALVGRVGSGKSTLVDAVARLLPVASGRLALGDDHVDELSLMQARRCIAYTPQQAFLFSQSLADNITYGIDASVGEEEQRERTARAVTAAGLQPDIAALPEGLETVVGERGVTLSGGQRQRVALARALAAQRSLLVLDDCFSAVDAATEARIFAALREMLPATTVILSSHRLSTLRHADQILVLDEGRVAESGTHDELIAGDTLYRQLYRSQTLSLS